MTDKGNSHADRLEQALGRLEENKKAAAEMVASIEPKLERLAALNKKLEALPQSERRQVLDAMGLKHVSAAPRPITPLRDSSHTPPNKPPKMVAMAEQKNKLSEEERNRTKELDAMRVPGDGGQSFSSRWLPSESQQQTPEPPAPPVVVAGASGGMEPNAWQLAASQATTTTPSPAPVVPVGASGDVARVRAKRRTWRDVTWPYMVEVVKAGQYKTGKEFYQALKSKAGTGDSPFDRGTGHHRDVLFVREISETLALKTIQTYAWKELKASRKTG